MKLTKFKSSHYALCGVLLLSIFSVLLILDKFVFPLPTSSIYKPSSTFVFSRDGQLMRCFLSSDGYWRKPVKLSEISPLLVKSVIACEDRWFYYHPGFNPISIFNAAIDNIKAGKVVKGGSTLTMQIARMLEPKERTIKSKGLELLRTIQLEFHYSKDELLEIYFNLAPYGGNIEGIGAATYFYYEKNPLELTASQTALLTLVPNSPNLLRLDRNSRSLIVKRNHILKTMMDRILINETTYNEAMGEEISITRMKAPFLAAHHSQKLAHDFPALTEIYSTIELGIQNICEGVASNNLSELNSKGINNIAIVVLNNSNSEILALVGSNSFFDYEKQGQVNGAIAPRSPGSALKPFIYAMGIESGYLSPNTMLSDLPVYYSGYSPENYDKQYRGIVTASNALKLSLNVPAVTLCSKMGLKEFYKLLKRGGLSTLNRRYFEYGLPIILGSCEVNLFELTNLYSSLARMGLYRAPKYLMNEPEGDTLQLFSQETSFIISDILSELKRPDFPSCWEFSPNIPKVAWKTGTSYGRKDAWSIGYNPEYTVGVWAGNFTGEPSPFLVGADVAAPVLFEIFEALSLKRSQHWFEQPSGVSLRMVCGKSGKRPGDYCGTTVSELYIPGISPEMKCDIHTEVIIDSCTGYILCRFCAPGKPAISKVIEDWDPKTATWLSKTRPLWTAIPEHNPECSGASNGDRPVIVSPNEDITYFIRNHISASQQGILLDAVAASGTQAIYWFVDGNLYGKVKPGQTIFLTPNKGTHKLTCVDDQGRSNSIIINIL